ncbi:kinase-like domain-containing protein [Phascolomyces articulosus]|uniref:Kinase-like domain-containing protein n=1 Tax=Phascolomyces articulosus TaxID=60185 RepID=A0AAD5K3N9_9FUNG|nr:kinase-like domain-containing protein [Phascolomyces articulosus]
MTPTTTTNTSSGFNPQSLLNTFIDNRSIQLISLLGVGAYGVVYLGVHVPTSRRYAVKLITKPESAENEIELHARASGHTGVLTLEKVVRDQENKRTFIVLEYASGGDLFTAITQQQGIAGNNRAIKHIFLQILDAVHHCHQLGIAHRDLKPENVLMFSNMQVKLADFGLATTQSVSAEFGCGSSFYFSPECQGQLVKNNERVKGYSTRQNDIWSLGVILVNLTAGRNPWRQATMKDPTFSTYVKKPRGFFKTILPCVSDEMSELLSRIFCLDPARRISLPELRLRVACMKSFTATNNKNTTTISSPSLHKIPQQQRHQQTPVTTVASPATLKYSRSLMHTLCNYIDGFSDDEDSQTEFEPSILRVAVGTKNNNNNNKNTATTIRSTPQVPSCPPPSSRLPPTPPSPCFSSSPCSSVSSLASQPEYPSTPRVAGIQVTEKMEIDFPADLNFSRYRLYNHA